MAELVRKTYYVWVTTITDAYTETVVGRLVRRNWTVTALGKTLSLRTDDNLATLLAFSISKTPESEKPEHQLPVEKAMEEVKDVLKRVGVRYNSVIISELNGAGAATWTLGNMSKSELAAIELDKKNVIN